MDVSGKTPVTAASLIEDGVQIWRIDLGGAAAAAADTKVLLESSAGVLSREEQAKAARMRLGGPSEEFRVGRACLRRLLGAVVDRNPASLVLEQGLFGKPFLRAEPGLVSPSFNVAHSHGMILIALSLRGEIGVDVEFVDRAIDLEGVARTAFHPDEVSRVLRASTLDERLRVFYGCWTRKEALAKADGRGLTLEPTMYVAGVDEAAEQRVMLPGAVGGEEYFVRELEAGPSHRAAVATRGMTGPVRTYRFLHQFGTVS